MASILVLHGPNLNLLGTREPETYGHDTLDAINQRLSGIAVEAGHHLQSLQSNAEHELIERFAFYERAKAAYAVVATGEPARYANIILKKGIVGD